MFNCKDEQDCREVLISTRLYRPQNQLPRIHMIYIIQYLRLTNIYINIYASVCVCITICQTNKADVIG